MSERLISLTASNIFNGDPRGVHYDFLKDRVPAWFYQATLQRQQELANHEMVLPSWYSTLTAQQKSALADSHTRYRETLNQVENTLGDIEAVKAFAEQPLKDAIKQRFNLDLDVNNVYLARKYESKGRDDLYGAFVFEQSSDPSLHYEYHGVSLLEAALANFEPDEERAIACQDCHVITNWGSYDDETTPTPSVIRAHAVAIAAHEFAQMCRSLDLGKLYQQHIKAIVQPDDDAQRSALETQLQEHQRQLLALSAEVAVHQPGWGISADAYRMIKQVIVDPGSASLDGRPVTFAALKVLGSVLVGPLMIGPSREDSGRVERLVVFIPNDPQQPLKEYPSSVEFMVDLRTRLHSASYRKFFSQFVPQREQGLFSQQFDRLYKPANGNGAAGDYPLVPQPVKLPLDEMAIHGNLWQQLREAHVRKIFSDARAVVVPTGDEDRKARMERLSSYLDAVISVFNLAAFVVPGLGPIMLAVGAAQMGSEVYEGIEAYEQGDLKTMWAHFSSVALNVAMLGTGAKVLPEVRLASMVDNLKPVTLPTGKQLLWNPDMTPYKVPVNLAQDAQPDALGLYSHNGQAVLTHEGDHYQVRQEPETGRYRIQHPSRPGAYEPLLEHNHAGAWSHEVEAPLTWDKPTLIRRLGLEQRGLDSEKLEQARVASGVEEDTLRQTFFEHEPVPLLLEDTIQRFKAHQELTTFVEQMRSSDPAVYAKADPTLQLKMMARRGMLPVDVPLRVLDGNFKVLWENDAPLTASRRVVSVTAPQMARGRLLDEVLNTLQSVDPTLKAIPGSAEDSLPVRAGKLREYLANIVDTFKGQLAEERYAASTATDDPDVRLIQGTYPRLPASMAGELLKSLTGEQLQAFRDSGILPEELPEQARWFEQETRVSRAYEGLHLDTLTDLDSQRLALRTLETLPGWRRGIRVELRQYSAQGTLLDAIGSEESTTRMTLVQKDNGLFEGPMPRDFYTAVWDLMPAAERQALGFTDALQMKAAIGRTPLPRAPLRTVLLEHPLRKPSVAPGARLLGGGRGFRRLLRRVFGISDAAVNARVRTLYPAMSDEQIGVFVKSLGSDVQGGLALREAELQTLQKELAVWVQANAPSTTDPFNPVLRFAQDIVGHWRRTSTGPLKVVARRGALELPALSADFSHVERLDLYGVKWSSNADALLGKFPRLKALSIRMCGLTELPAALGEMNTLTSLDLSGNDIRLTRQSARMLGGLGNLETLYLSGNPLEIAPDFSAMPRLQRLNLRFARLTQWPTGLDAHTGLEVVDLSQNLLREVPARYLSPSAEQFEAIARLNNVTLLEGNPFPDDYWQQFDRYWRRVADARLGLENLARDGAFDSGNPRLAKIRKMYPNKPPHEARAWVWLLEGEADAVLGGLEVEFNTLERQLNAWTMSGGGERQRYMRANQRHANEVGLDDRYQAKQRILKCWRRETPQMLSNDGQPIGLELDLSDLALPSLPDLDVDFSHVGSLKLNNMGLNASPEGFLTRYRHLRWLDLSNNQLRELPPALGEMHGLTRLFLNDNQIRLNPQTAQILSQRTTLRALWLHSNNLGVSPDFSLITDMRSLVLNRAGIDTWPQGLAEQPRLDQIDLRNNDITTIPASVIAPPEARLTQTARVNDVTFVSGNPLTEQTLQQVREYSQRLEQAGLASADSPNRLVATALNFRAPVVLGEGASPLFQHWTQGLPADAMNARMAQWQALRDRQGADPFFDILNRLEPAGPGHADLQRRVWEVLDSISENTPESDSHREELFARAGEPGCCDRAAFSFSNLEVVSLVYKARAQATEQAHGAQLSSLSKGLFRLQEVDKFASADIQRSQAIVDDPGASMSDKFPHIQRLSEEVEIRLAYRFGLKERLQLPGQPPQVRFTSMGAVTPAMLDAAYDTIIAMDNSATEFQALLSREFWQDYVTHKYRAQFDAQSEPYQQHLAALHETRVAEQLSEAAYKEKADELQAQLAIKESVLIETLSRQEVADILLPREDLEVLVEPSTGAARGLQLSQARCVDLAGKQYFVASMPDGGDGENYVLWVQAPDNPYALISSGIIAKPDLAGVWKRRGSVGGMVRGDSEDEFADASESVPMVPYTAAELSYMRKDVHFANTKNVLGSYNRANNGKYPLRDYQGRPIRIRKIQRSVELVESGTQYTSEQVKPYIKFEGYEEVGARYEQKLQLREFTAQDMKVPEEKSLIGQSMVVANKRIAKGEIVGVYGGTVLPSSAVGPENQTYTMLVSSRPILGGMQLGREPIYLSGDNIVSRINTTFEYSADGKPVRQASGGYNVEGVPFDVEADMWLGMGPEARQKRKDFTLTAVFATQDIAAGAELRMDYQYSEDTIKLLTA